MMFPGIYYASGVIPDQETPSPPKARRRCGRVRVWLAWRVYDLHTGLCRVSAVMLRLVHWLVGER